MKECFGTMYPDLSNIRFGKELNGKVFRVLIDTRGPGHRERHLQADLKEWEACQQCELYRSCYDLSMANLAMQQAVASI